MGSSTPSVTPGGAATATLAAVVATFTPNPSQSITPTLANAEATTPAAGLQPTRLLAAGETPTPAAGSDFSGGSAIWIGLLLLLIVLVLGYFGLRSRMGAPK